MNEKEKKGAQISTFSWKQSPAKWQLNNQQYQLYFPCVDMPHSWFSIKQIGFDYDLLWIRWIYFSSISGINESEKKNKAEGSHLIL